VTGQTVTHHKLGVGFLAEASFARNFPASIQIKLRPSCS
jgi:hypothetical protein